MSLESEPWVHFSSDERPEVTKRSLGLEDAIKRGAKVCVITCVEVTLREYALSQAARMPLGLGSERIMPSKAAPGMN